MAKTRKQSTRLGRLITMFSVSCLSLSLAFTLPVFAQNQDIDFDIKPQSMRSALLAYSEQAGVQLILAVNTSGIRLFGTLNGSMSLREALDRLINGTGLTYEFTSENTVTITRVFVPKIAVVKSETPLVTQENTEIVVDPVPGIEEIILVGSRKKYRTSVSTPVPIDVMTAAALASTGETEIGRMLQVLAPSFNVSNSFVSDGTDALRPATLRGLGPDQTLVLVNGKRRHTSALVHVNTSVGRGTAGVDLNAIPMAALHSIEVLRDGAAAQYGSDAIAGVINLRLKGKGAGNEVSVYYGQTYSGDGGVFVASGHFGFEFGNDAFLNISAEYTDQGQSDRANPTGAVQYPLLNNGGACNETDNSGCDPREFKFNRQNFIIGTADSVHGSLVVNTEIPVSDTMKLYGFGTYSHRDSQSAGFYRRANEYGKTVEALYPDGFLPLINSHIKDHSLTGGAEWDLDSGWGIDFSVNYGRNTFEFNISNSLNASFGADSPREAEAGILNVRQTSVNLDVVKPLLLGDLSSNFAFGFEYREENYVIKEGDAVSYGDGGVLNTSCIGCDVSPVAYESGFQVFRGFSPDNAVDEMRSNMSFYADLESEINSDWTVALAARFEGYSDFGHKLTGKIATRYEVAKGFAIRGSVSSGFRAPSVQQKYFNSISTQFVEVDGAPVSQSRGTFRNDSLVAELAGVPELEEETSLGFSAGFVADIGALNLTADYYYIHIEDRIGISSAIDLMQHGFEELAGAASSGQFFVNAANTSTNGLDFVATYEIAVADGHALLLAAAANWTQTRVDRDSIVHSIGDVDVGRLFTPQDISIIEEWQPTTRMNLSATYVVGNWNIVGRFTQYGTYTVCEGSCDSLANIQKFGSKVLTDVQVNYAMPDSGFRFTVGANNLFSVHPDENRIGQSRAGTIKDIVSSPGVFKYSRRSSPFGFNGGYWYAKASYAF